MERYQVQVIPNDRDPNNFAMIHLGTCSDAQKGMRMDTVEERMAKAELWWGPYGTYRRAEQEAATNHRTGAHRAVIDCPTCNPSRI